MGAVKKIIGMEESTCMLCLKTVALMSAKGIRNIKIKAFIKKH